MKKLIIVVAAIALSGCTWFDPEVEPTTKEQAQALADSFIYVKNNKGLCFGVTTTSRVSTNATAAYNNHVVSVDCKIVGL